MNKKIYAHLSLLGAACAWGLMSPIGKIAMEDAVNAAYQMAQKGETVLLSPWCASFDLFKSYEDRGEQFKQCVRKL